MTTETLMPEVLQKVITNAFVASNTAPETAAMVAAALTLAEIDGKGGHGLSRVASYAAQARSGKVDGMAKPVSSQPKPAVLAIDACHGFAYPAFDLLQQQLPALARSQGIALGGIYRSHHFGVAGHQVEKAADSGFIALLLGNTPAAIAPWGGSNACFGTNPIAFACPLARMEPANQPQSVLPGDGPLVIDMAVSEVARGGIMKAARRGEPIPEGWALDADGKPTCDAEKALAGTMLPFGGAKGAALALMVEILSAGLTGASFAADASSFFTAEGSPPDVGQVMILIDPGVFTATSISRITALAAAIAADGNARIPGSTRYQKRRLAREQGVTVDAMLLAEARALAGG